MDNRLKRGILDVCAGLSILAFYGCKRATKGAAMHTGKIVLWFKDCFTKREDPILTQIRRLFPELCGISFTFALPFLQKQAIIQSII